MALLLSKLSRLKSALKIPSPYIQLHQSRYSTTKAEVPEKNSMSAKRRFFWVPRPSKFCPNVGTFLSLIGRNMNEHASKFPDWASLFRLQSDELKRLGIGPPRNRRYLLYWREKYRQGNLGIGADFKYVKDGIAHLHVAKIPKDAKVDKMGIEFTPRSLRKIVVNTPIGIRSVDELPPEKLVPVKGFRVRGANTIVGPHALPMKGGKGSIVIQKEGMWEIKRGCKIDGGERRQAEVRAKRRQVKSTARE